MNGLYTHPKYPLMERQDLTQGQLGSFKFTPVDPTSTLGDTPWLLAAQAQLRARAGDREGPALVTADDQSNIASRIASQLGVHQNSQSFYSALPFDSFHRTAIPTSDPAFFNKHIKPDLEESRLKLGPAAFRAAVVGNSPDKSFSQTRTRAESDLTNVYHSAILRRPVSKMNPNASAFDPSGSASDTDENRVMLSYNSLVSCLEAEQERQQQTRKRLAQVLSRIDELEALVEKLQTEKRSLAGSVKLLASIVQHNKARREDRGHAMSEASVAEVDLSPVRKSFMTPQEAASKDAGVEVADTQAKACIALGTTDDSIVTNTMGISQPVDSNVNDGAVTSGDHTKRFNLDLLKPDESPNTPASLRSRILRKHFAVARSSDSSVDYAAEDFEIRKPAVSTKLAGTILTKVDASLKDQDQAATPLIQDTTRNETDATAAKKYLPVKLQTVDEPMLQLPAAFLTKYQRGGKKQSNGDSPSKTDVSTDTFTKNDSNGKPITSFATSLHSLNARPSNLADASAPYSLSIKWSINKENPIFDDDEWPLRGNYSDEQLRDVFWKHPVRYLDHDSKNIFRTVMIDYIPADATYSDVLGEICAGALEKIELVPAIGGKNNYKTARVVFNFELGASTTANFARDHGMKIKGQTVRVWQVLTQTYPKNNANERNVHMHGFTRVLIINNANEAALSMLPIKLDRFKTSIVKLSETYDRFPMVEFTSVAAAVQAMRVLMSDYNFQGAEFDFDEDPCGEPYRYTR